MAVFALRRRSRVRRRDTTVVLGAIALYLVITVVRWAVHHLLLTSLAVIAALIVGGWWAARTVHGRIRVHRVRWAAPTSIGAYMAASPDEFERQTAALCRRDGCTRVRVVGGAGDLAADVLATAPDGRKVLVQCKRYAIHNLVGSDHVQRVNGTYRDIHHCQQAIIVTTSAYTRDARALARRVGIRLIDHDGLARWAAGGRPPWTGTGG